MGFRPYSSRPDLVNPTALPATSTAAAWPGPPPCAEGPRLR